MDIDLEDYFLLDDVDTGGRTIAIFYNQSSTVFYGAIALGVFFTATAIGLVIYYLTTLGGGGSSYGRSYDHWSAPNARFDSLPWVRILAELERAFALYGVQEADRDCRERLVCEVYAPGATDANLEASLHLSEVVGKLTPEVTAYMDSPELSETKRLLDAANRGRKEGDCTPYERLCKNYSLRKLVPRKKNEDFETKSVISFLKDHH